MNRKRGFDSETTVTVNWRCERIVVTQRLKIRCVVPLDGTLVDGRLTLGPCFSGFVLMNSTLAYSWIFLFHQILVVHPKWRERRSIATHVSGDWMVHPKSKSTKQDKEEASKVFSNPPVLRCQSQQKVPSQRRSTSHELRVFVNTPIHYAYSSKYYFCISFVFRTLSFKCINMKTKLEPSKETASFLLTIFQGKFQFSIVIRLPLDFLTETSTRIICNQSTRHAQPRWSAGLPVSASCT